MKETWFDLALKILGGLSLITTPTLWFLNRGRKQANVSISKTEAEVYKNLVENKLADLNLSEIIETKVQHHIDKFKNLLWDAQEEHYKVKLDMQERMIRTLKEKNEVEQENAMLKNELTEMREEHQSCIRQIDDLRKEVNKLKNTKS